LHIAFASREDLAIARQSFLLPLKARGAIAPFAERLARVRCITHRSNFRRGATNPSSWSRLHLMTAQLRLIGHFRAQLDANHHSLCFLNDTCVFCLQTE
jgi:hypothetical protein